MPAEEILLVTPRSSRHYVRRMTKCSACFTLQCNQWAFLYRTMRSLSSPLHLNGASLSRRTLLLWKRPMGKGSRTRVRSLRLTDLWSRRRTQPAFAHSISLNDVVVRPESSSSSNSRHSTCADNVLLVTVDPRGALDGAISISPSNPLGDAQDSNVLYAPPCTPVLASDSIMDPSGPKFYINSTVSTAARVRPSMVVDPPPIFPSVLSASISDTDSPLPPNKRRLPGHKLPPRQRPRVSPQPQSFPRSPQRGGTPPISLEVATNGEMASHPPMVVPPPSSPLLPATTPTPSIAHSLKRKRLPPPSHVSPTRVLPYRACKRTSLAPAPIQREYLTTPRISMPGVLLGLSASDIPGAGLGVFLRDNYPAGTRLATYGGRSLTPAELAAPNYDTTYVWSDTNQDDLLRKRGLHPLIIDANPQFSPLDWGGMINDGLTRPANVSLVRHRNQVYVTLLVDGIAGEELYLEYGGPYWQDRFSSLPHVTQEEVLIAYGLSRCGQECYTTSELYRLQQDRKVHRSAGQWLPVPPAAPDPTSPSSGPQSESLLSWLLGVPPKVTKPAPLISWLSAPPSPGPTQAMLLPDSLPSGW